MSNNEANEWLTLLKKRKYLPSYFPVKKAIKYKTGVIDTAMHSMNACYVYLTNLRVLYAFPKTVKVTQALYKEGVDFDLAYAIGCQFGVKNFNHHYIERRTGFSVGEITFNIPTSYMFRLKMFLNTINDIGPEQKYYHWTGFTCSHSISCIHVPRNIAQKEITRSNVFDKEIDKIIKQINITIEKTRETFIKKWNTKNKLT